MKYGLPTTVRPIPRLSRFCRAAIVPDSGLFRMVLDSCRVMRTAIGEVTMSSDDRQARLAVAAEEFNLHEHRDTGSRVATNLADGFNTLRDAFFTRVYDDVEQVVGTDSMLMPISRVKSEMAAK